MIGLVTQDMTSEFYSIMYEQMLVRAQREGFLFSIMCGQYSPDFPSVEWNNYTTVRKLVHCFAADGYKRIAYAGSTYRRQDSNLQRRLGYMQGMRDEGLDPEKLLISLEPQEAKPYKLSNHFDFFMKYIGNLPRDQWPEIVLCEHDAVALAVTNSLLSAGIRVPEDIQVFGFDNTSHVFFARPKLSTVLQNPQVLGNAAFDMLYALIKGEEHARHVRLEQEVIIRSSAYILKDYLDREGLRYVYDC